MSGALPTQREKKVIELIQGAWPLRHTFGVRVMLRSWIRLAREIRRG